LGDPLREGGRAPKKQNQKGFSTRFFFFTVVHTLREWEILNTYSVSVTLKTENRCFNE